MKLKMSALSGRYLTALRNHLKQSPQASLEPARELGRQAAALGLETLDVARLHERALATLDASGNKDALKEQANAFFAEAIHPSEQTHPNAGRTSAHLKRLNKTLTQRSFHLTAANRSLKKGIARRKTVEVALKRTGEHYKTLMEESLALQDHLQRLTRQAFSEQENKRKEISLDLRDEIAQTLLGINVRLLTLKKAAGHNAQSLQKKLASTQRVVDMTVKIVEGFAREFGKRSRRTS